MKNYKDILTEVKIERSPGAKATRFSTIAARSEDDELQKLISPVVQTLCAIRDSKKEQKGIQKMHYSNLLPPLIEYCEERTKNQIPEWQVIAERNNWGPLELTEN